MSILYHNTFPTQVNTSSISSLMSYFEPLFEADSENHIILLFVLIWAVSLDVNSDAKTIVDLVLKPSIDQEKEAWEKLETDSTVVGDVTARSIISPWYRSTNSGTPMSASTKRCRRDWRKWQSDTVRIWILRGPTGIRWPEIWRRQPPLLKRHFLRSSRRNEKCVLLCVPEQKSHPVAATATGFSLVRPTGLEPVASCVWRFDRDVFRTVSAVLNGFAEEFHHP